MVNRWVIVAGIAMATSLYGGPEEQQVNRENSASQTRPEVKNRYHKRGDELLAEIDANMSAARQFSAPKDEQLAESIRTKVLDTESNKYDRIGVVVNRGHVSLWGEVPTQQDKEYLEKQMAQIEGMRSFNNQLTVAAGTGGGNEVRLKDHYETRGDQEIIKRIRDKIQGDPLSTLSLNIELNTYDGIVTVKGNVKGTEIQRQLIDLIKQVQGVRGVNNHLKDQ